LTPAAEFLTDLIRRGQARSGPPPDVPPPRRSRTADKSGRL
jgi:hypothetical protein